MNVRALAILLLAATASAAPDISSIVATNSSAIVIFTEAVNGSGYWQLSYAGSPVAANTFTLTPAAAQTTVSYATQTTAGNYSFTYSITVGYGTNFSSSATLSKTAAFTLLPPPTPTPTATPNPYKLNIISPTGGFVISDSTPVAGTVGGAIPAAVQVAPVYGVLVQSCDAVSGFQNATLVGGGWTWYWAVREKSYRQGDYVLYARAVDANLATLACATVQLSVGSNTSAPSATAAATEAAPTTTWTCNRKPCTCDTAQLNQEITTIFSTRGKLTVRLQGAAQKVAESASNDAIAWKPSKAGTYQIYLNDKKVEECDIGAAKPSTAGGTAYDYTAAYNPQRCGGYMPAGTPDEISAGTCLPIGPCTPSGVQIAGVTQAFQLAAGATIVCSGFAAPVYYRVANLQNALDYSDSTNPSPFYPTGRKETYFNFTPRFDGVYLIQAKKELTDQWTSMAAYLVFHPRADWVGPFLGVAMVIVGFKFVRAPTLQTDRFVRGEDGSGVAEYYRFVRRKVMTMRGAHSSVSISELWGRRRGALRERWRIVTYDGESRPYLRDEGERWKGRLFHICSVSGGPLSCSAPGDIHPPTKFFAKDARECAQLIADWRDLKARSSRPRPSFSLRGRPPSTLQNIDRTLDEKIQGILKQEYGPKE